MNLSKNKGIVPLIIIFLLTLFTLAFIPIHSTSIPHPIRNTVQQQTNYHKAWLIFKKDSRSINSNDQSNINDKISYLKKHQNQFDIQGINNKQNIPQNLFLSKNKQVELVPLKVGNSSTSSINDIRKIHSQTEVPYFKTYLTGSNLIQQQLRKQAHQKFILVVSLAFALILILLFYLTKNISFSLLSIFSLWCSTIFSVHLGLISIPNNIWLPYLFLISSLILGTAHILCNGLALNPQSQSSINHQEKQYFLPVVIPLSLVSLFWCCQFSLALIMAELINYISSSATRDLLTYHHKYLQHCLLTADYHYHLPIIVTSFLAVLALVIGGFSLVHLPNKMNTLTVQNSLLPNNYLSKGQQVINHYFGKGYLTADNIYISSPKNLYSDAPLQKIDELTNQFKQQKNIAHVQSVTQPTGNNIPQLHVNDQLSLFTGKHKINHANNSLNLSQSSLKNVKRINANVNSIQTALQDIQVNLKPLNKKQKNVVKKISNQVNNIKNSTRDINNTSKDVDTQLSSLQKSLSNANNSLSKLSHSFKSSRGYLSALQSSPVADDLYVPQAVLNSKDFKSIHNTYMSNHNHTAKIQILFKSIPNHTIESDSIYKFNNQIQAVLAGTGLSSSITNQSNMAQNVQKQNGNNNKLILVLISSILFIIILAIEFKSWTVFCPATISILGIASGLVVTTNLLNANISILLATWCLVDGLISAIKAHQINVSQIALDTLLLGVVILSLLLIVSDDSSLTTNLGVALFISVIFYKVFNSSLYNFIQLLVGKLSH